MSKIKRFANINAVANRVHEECKSYKRLFSRKKVDENSVAEAEKALRRITNNIYIFKLDKKEVSIKLIGAHHKIVFQVKCKYGQVKSVFKKLNQLFFYQEHKHERDDKEFYARHYKYRCLREGQNCLF